MTTRATFPQHLYFDLLSAAREFRMPGCFVELVQDTGVASFKGRSQSVSASMTQFEKVVRRLQREDLTKAQAYVEEGTTPGPIYEPVHGAVAVPTSGHSPKVVASYSWNMADPDEPYTIPGHLRTYCKPKTPLSLAAGDEAYEPSSWETTRGRPTAMEPIVVSCAALDPSFSLLAYQVVTDRNNLRKIFRWACGNKSRWRIDLEKVGLDTIAMLRFDPSEEGEPEHLQERKRSGYRFEDLCCADGDDGGGSASSDSYRAVLEFDMAGTRFLMRCEIDAAMPSQESEVLESQLAQLSLASQPLRSNMVFQRSCWPLAPEFVELASMIDQRFEQPRDLKEMKDQWFQAYIAGVHTRVFGLKLRARDKMVVKSIVELSSSELLQQELTETMNVVGFVRECLADEPVGAVHSLYFEPTDPQPVIRLRSRATVDQAFASYVYDQQPYAVIDAVTQN